MREASSENPPMEIERKFKVKSLPPGLEQYPKKEIIQGYLSSGARLRCKDGRFFETIKKGTGLVREEVEYEISADEFAANWLDTVGARIEKVRYEIELPGGFIAELDVYSGDLAGNMVVEVEFNDVQSAEKFEPPEWFGDDVTDNDSYGNVNLAKHGWPKDD